MSLSHSTSMGEIYSLSLNSIDFYVPVRIPRLYWIETTLQVSENVNLFTICRTYKSVTSEKG
jgi:hypothetical protein